MAIFIFINLELPCTKNHSHITIAKTVRIIGGWNYIKSRPGEIIKVKCHREEIIMAKLEDAVNKIKNIECPTGDVKSRVADILDDYGISQGNEIVINRERSLDRDGAQAYITNVSDNGEKSIVILAKSGLDDYVAKVVDAYID